MRLFKSKVLKRFVTVTLSLILLLTSAIVIVPENSYDVSALSSEEIQDKIDSYEKKQEEIQGKIDSLQDDKDSAQQKADNLEEQVEVIENKVSLMNDKISALESEIAEKTNAINAKEAEIKDAKELLKQRLKAIYIAGASTDLLVLLSAEDYSDFLQKSDVMKCITTDTKKLMEDLEDDISAINSEKKEIEAKKSETDALKQELVTEQTVLDNKYKEAQAAYSEIAGNEKELKAEAEKIEAEMDKLKEELDRLARERAEQAQNNPDLPKVSVDGGSYGFAWPYGGSYYISSGYGYRMHPVLGYYKLHTGIDISGAAAYGKPIYAIADGQVILSSYYGGYGNTVMIDHGTYDGVNLVSLYAHSSSLCVSNGATVKKGQLIAYVGSTGQSTGPHLHFEIRANGSCVNPLNYYSNY